MVKALFFHHRRVRLPERYEVHTFAAAGFTHVEPEFVKEIRRFFAPLINSQPTSLGRVFSYWKHFDADDPNVSVWLMLFYRRVVFMSFTLPLGAISAEQAGM